MNLQLWSYDGRNCHNRHGLGIRVINPVKYGDPAIVFAAIDGMYLCHLFTNKALSA